MTKKDSLPINRDALRDINAHPERPFHHEDAMQRYLAGEAYLHTKRSRVEPPKTFDRKSRKII